MLSVLKPLLNSSVRASAHAHARSLLLRCRLCYRRCISSSFFLITLFASCHFIRRILFFFFALLYISTTLYVFFFFYFILLRLFLQCVCRFCRFSSLLKGNKKKKHHTINIGFVYIYIQTIWIAHCSRMSVQNAHNI